MTCPEHFSKEFDGPAVDVTLLPGSRLYKFVSIPIDRQRIMSSPWWIREEAFDGFRREMKVRGTDLKRVARERLAIADRWSPGMDGLFIITLAQPKSAFIGHARGQSLAFGANLIGGGEQLCVPDLDWRDVAVQKSEVPFFMTSAW